MNNFQKPIKSLANRLCVLGTATSLLCACSVVGSYQVDVNKYTTTPAYFTKNDAGCTTEAGSYSLPFTTWKFEITQNQDRSGPFVLNEIETEDHPDPNFTFCMDYLTSVLANDSIAIGFATTGATDPVPNGLLDYVASFAIDQSARVISNIINTIFIGISGNPALALRSAQFGAVQDQEEVGRFEVNPLDDIEMAQLNDRLRDFGFCLILDKYSFEESWNVTPEKYCSDPVWVAKSNKSNLLDNSEKQTWLKENASKNGVLYRPRLPYNLHVYTRIDHDSPWRLRRTEIVELPNLAPVLSLGVDRAAFAQKRIGYEFENGVLEEVCINKTSELAGFIDIPLDIVFGVASLPSATVLSQIDRVRNTNELLTAQNRLIDANDALIQQLEGQDSTVTAPSGDPVLNTGALPPGEELQGLQAPEQGRVARRSLPQSSICEGLTRLAVAGETQP